MIVCSCNVLSCRQIKSTVEVDGRGPRTAGEAYDRLGCMPSCGRCAREIRALLAEARAACATQCGACARADVACAVHVALDAVVAGNDRAAA